MTPRRGDAPPGLAEVRTAIEASGLAFRGAFHPDPDDLPAGEAAGTLVLLGFIGAGQWPAFKAAPEYRDDAPHPLDRWSRRVIEALAADLGARAFFPFGGLPFLPFIRWAKKAEPLQESAIGMLIHPEHGLWHAWRGALAFDAALDLPAPDRRPSPCETCTEKPCLAACPVDAFAHGAYDAAACKAHLGRPDGADCMAEGCRARRACPVGRDSQYALDQAAFHMKSFRGGS